jgi:hypothetical protein
MSTTAGQNYMSTTAGQNYMSTTAGQNYMSTTAGQNYMPTRPQLQMCRLEGVNSSPFRISAFLIFSDSFRLSKLLLKIKQMLWRCFGSLARRKIV